MLPCTRRNNRAKNLSDYFLFNCEQVRFLSKSMLKVGQPRLYEVFLKLRKKLRKNALNMRNRYNVFLNRLLFKTATFDLETTIGNVKKY